MQRRGLVWRAIALAATLGGSRCGDGRGASARPFAAADDRRAPVAGGAVFPSTTPGQKLRLARLAREPGWSEPFAGGAFVACVASGRLAAELATGAAGVWRADEGGAPTFADLLPGRNIVLWAGDCFAVDADRAPTSGRLHNAGPENAEVWEAALAAVPLTRPDACPGAGAHHRLDTPPARGSHAGVR